MEGISDTAAHQESSLLHHATAVARSKLQGSARRSNMPYDGCCGLLTRDVLSFTVSCICKSTYTTQRPKPRQKIRCLQEKASTALTTRWQSSASCQRVCTSLSCTVTIFCRTLLRKDVRMYRSVTHEAPHSGLGGLILVFTHRLYMLSFTAWMRISDKPSLSALAGWT